MFLFPFFNSLHRIFCLFLRLSPGHAGLIKLLHALYGPKSDIFATLRERYSLCVGYRVNSRNAKLFRR